MARKLRMQYPGGGRAGSLDASATRLVFGGGGISEGAAGAGQRATGRPPLRSGVARGRGGKGGVVGGGRIGAAEMARKRTEAETEDRWAEGAHRTAPAAGDDYDAGVDCAAIADGKREHIEEHATLD